MRLPDIHVRDEDVAFRAPEALSKHLAAMPEVAVAEIGQSREGRPLYAYRFGSGPLPVSITAGAHADEPAGPMTAQILPRLLREHAPDLLEAFQFHVAPQVNPDGAGRNRPWFAATPDFSTYVRCAVREAPGDDIEFGYGGTPDARPECRAVLGYLKDAAPYAAHFSLHGMAYAQGAWFLLCREWAERGTDILDALRARCADDGFPLHDIERHGEKGFHRLGPGACTTPMATAMRAHFLEQGDPAMAAKFLPSSMEAVSAWGGDTLCMVSELPIFLLRHQDGTLEKPASSLFRDALGATDLDDDAALAALAETFAITTVPFTVQIRYQCAMIIAALRCVQTQPGGADGAP